MTKTITFRTDKAKLDALDTIAESQDRDRSYILNQAIDAYLDVHQWQVEQIQKALAEAEADDFATEQEVAAVTHKYRRKA